MTNERVAREMLGLLWDRYAREVPYARRFVELAGGRFDNDHVALRSLRRPGSGIGLFAPLFERLGWRRAGTYDFPDAKLSAIHLSHPAGLPRVFISELRQEELSARARALLAQLPGDEPPPPSDDPAVLAAWFRAPGLVPAESELLELESESQYGAWLLLFGREVNHFTASVDSVEAWAERLRAAGVPMKGELEGAPGAGLRQTATRAAPREVRVARDGNAATRAWPYAYLELAERHGGFDGFVAAQARQLFDMTRR